MFNAFLFDHQYFERMLETANHLFYIGIEMSKITRGAKLKYYSKIKIKVAQLPCNIAPFPFQPPHPFIDIFLLKYLIPPAPVNV